MDCLLTENKGFSLIELAVVMILLIILAAIGIPNLGKVMPRYHLKEAARNLYGDFQLAKATAIKEGTPCTVEFINGGYQIFLDLNQNLERDGNETSNQYLVKSVSWSSFDDVQVDSTGGITFQANNNGNPAISFLTNGLTANNGGGFGAGTVNLASSVNNNMKIQITVGSTGNIRIP